MHNLELYNLIITSILVGVIIITQIVNYPLFKNINHDFSSIHKQYVAKIGITAGPMMVLELLILIALLIQNFDNIIIQLMSGLVFIIWISTFGIQVPIHNQLASSNKKNLNVLIYSNWIRTICWILKLILSSILFI
ncbi:MAG: hypothetical protein CMP49_05395 [Flavobacteriales bacterium]|jgi:hypothetical protein|nr:hypothetical protein [Flavobacteriales bacterium]|tara:strand:+ start:771 stop:1178 length:408 start_codon:yes stop_codon:yes gene_type:complete